MTTQTDLHTSAQTLELNDYIESTDAIFHDAISNVYGYAIAMQQIRAGLYVASYDNVIFEIRKKENKWLAIEIRTQLVFAKDSTLESLGWKIGLYIMRITKTL